MKIKKRESWADRRFKRGASYTRNAVSVSRARQIDIDREVAASREHGLTGLIEAATLAQTGQTPSQLLDHLIQKSHENGVRMEASNDEFDTKTGLFVNKGKKDGRCNRTACQHRIGAHPELSEYAPQFVMEPPFTAGEQLFYCRVCAAMFTESDDRFGNDRRVSLYVEQEAA